MNDDIKTLSNREVDVLVATEVMGYKHFQFTRDDGSKFVMLLQSDDAAHIASIAEREPVEVESGDDLDAARLYTTDPAASKAVRDRMRALGWMREAEDRRLLVTDQIEHKTRYRRWGSVADVSAIAATEERADAEAAILAVRQGGGK